MDVMEVNRAYCGGKNESPLGMCGVVDAIGVNPPVLESRVCDNYVDCPDGVDEFGSLGECEPEGTIGECCSKYMLDGIEFTYTGDFYGRPYYTWDTNGTWGENVTLMYIVYVDYFHPGESWYMAPQLPTNTFCYYEQVSSNSSCPTSGMWTTGVTNICKSNGYKSLSSNFENFDEAKMTGLNSSLENNENNILYLIYIPIAMLLILSLLYALYRYRRDV
jgi:hypothetical protein